MSVIFTRAPLRISLGGGGTDLPSYYREHGGFLVGGAIDKYVYMLTHTVFQRRYRMKYSAVRGGRRRRARSGTRSCARRCCATGAASPLEIASVADVPAGTGMGSSGAYTVCLLKALALASAHVDHARARSPSRRARSRSTSSRSRSASRTSTSPRTAASAPTRSIPTARVDVEPLELDPETLRKLRNNFLLFYTGEARAASTRARRPGRAHPSGDDEMLANLHRTKEMGYQSRDLLLAGDLDVYARADARALGEQAQALAGDGQRAHRHALHARAAQRRDRRQARRRGRRRVPARLRAAARATRARRWRRRERPSSRSTSSSRAATRTEYA